MSAKYECKLCEFITRNKFDYTRHTKTNRHTLAVNQEAKICTKCNKKYKSKKCYDKHVSSGSCETPSVIAGSTNCQVAINSNMNTIASNNTIHNTFVLDPDAFHGKLRKYAKRVLSENTIALLDEYNITKYNEHLHRIVERDFKHLDVLDSIILTQEDIDTIASKDGSDRYLELRAKLQEARHAISELSDILDGNRMIPAFSDAHIDSVKIWLAPNLLTDEEKQSITSNKEYDADREYNNKLIDEYIIGAIVKSMQLTYMNRTDETRSMCLFPETKERIYYKDQVSKYKKSKLKHLTAEVIEGLANDYEMLNEIIFAHLNQYLVKERTFRINPVAIQFALSEALSDLIDGE